MSQVALVVVDVQVGFFDPEIHYGSQEKQFCLAGIKKALAIARERNWSVIHVGTMHESEKTLPAYQRRRGTSVYCRQGTDSAAFVLQHQPGEAVIYKRWYSAFEGTDLDDRLSGMDAVVWVGVAADCCISQSAFDGDRRGLRSIVPIEAVSASTLEAFVASLIGLSKSAAEVVSIDTLETDVGRSFAGLDAEAVEERAGSWFEERESSLVSDPG